MIVDALFALVTFLLDPILQSIPDAEAPAWMDDSATAISMLLSGGHSLGVWLPWNLLGIVVLAALGSHVVGFGIKTARMLLSLFTAGGGSAA